MDRKMILRPAFAAVFFAVLLAMFLVACSSSPRAETGPAPQTSAKQHFFWKVSDSNSTIYILGSVHFADSSFYPLDPVIDTAFAHAEELAVEIDIGNDSVSNEVAQKSMQQGLLPAGTTLNQILPRPLWNSLDSICASWNFPVTALMPMKPWFAATTLSVVAIQRVGIDPSYGVDMVLLDRAAVDGKAIVSLETADEQVGAIADSSESDSAGIYYLKTTLREISELDSMVTRMIRAWKTGDDVLLRQVMNEESEGDSPEDEALRQKMEDKVYTSRNGKMAESIAQFLAEDRSVFVVVGAAHLVLDDDNVIELLRKRGFSVERL